jgi:hypothetical protein
MSWFQVLIILILNINFVFIRIILIFKLFCYFVIWTIEYEDIRRFDFLT